METAVLPESTRTKSRRPALRIVTLSILAASLPLLPIGCSLTGPGGAASRSFAMGFTDFPYALTFDAMLETWDVIAGDGDMAVLHFDCGVPWQEALEGTDYPASWTAEFDFSAGQIPFGHTVYLAITPISNSRDGLALYRGDMPNEPLPPPWDGYTFDSPDVIAAYKAHCENMIATFAPDYFAYAIEANMVNWLAPDEWDAFLNLAEAVYADVKANHPDLPIFLTLQADTYHSHLGAQSAAVRQLLPYTDMIAVSGYPFTEPLSDPELLRADYFTALADLAPEKAFAVAETGWPAEDVSDPYPIPIAASDTTQQIYVTRVIDDCDLLEAQFVCWFFSRDYDDIWESDFQYLPEAWLYRLWRDTGLYAGDGTARPALATWLQALQRGS